MVSGSLEELQDKYTKYSTRLEPQTTRVEDGLPAISEETVVLPREIQATALEKSDPTSQPVSESDDDNLSTAVDSLSGPDSEDDDDDDIKGVFMEGDDGELVEVE